MKKNNTSLHTFLLAIVFLLAVNFSYSQQNDIFSAEDMTASVDISSSIDIVPLDDEWRISRVSVEQTFFPRESSYQSVLDLKTEPFASKNDSAFLYLWQPPKQNELEFSLHGEVRVNYGFVPVGKKISFPISNLPGEYEKYIEPQSNIDSSTRAIIEKASELAKGEDDLYVVAFNIADWVENNIKYSLDSLTAEVSQKASWVLKNKEGVCDELTSLFIAMLRSLGIPARYISGVAYTNWNNLNDFGPHAWAEVYFPGYGWVPFDIAYGEFGFVDASHIKLKESIDSNEPTVNYRWEGWLVDVKTHKLNIDANVLSAGKKLEPNVQIDVSMLKNSVKFGSFNLVEAEISNPTDFYQPIEVSISRSTGLEVTGLIRKQVLLLPGERKKVYWIIRVNDDLDKSFIYTFRILVQTTRNATAETTFTSTIRDQSYSLGYIQNVLLQRTEERQKVYSKNVTLSCLSDKQEYYEDEVINIKCSAKNNGNTFLENINICRQEDCKTLSLGITETSPVEFFANFSDAGVKSIDITAKSPEISKSAALEITMLDRPNVNIGDISVPSNVEFGKTYTAEFTLKKDSFSEPVNLNVVLKSPLGSREWQISNLSQDRKFYVNFESRLLNEGQNQFQVILSYEDKLGRKYSGEMPLYVELANLDFVQKMQVLLNKIGRNLSSLDLKLVVFAAFVFGIIIGIVFRRGKGRKEHEAEKKAEGK